MAEEVKAAATVDAAKPSEEPAPPADAPADSTVVDAKPADGGEAVTSSEAVEGTKPSPSKEDASAETTNTDDANADTKKVADDAAAAPPTDTATTNGTPASSKKGAQNKRKSGAGVPEHKKKTPSKKKSAVELRLDIQPGEMYSVAMKGYQPWPVIVCDEEMLPEALLSKRPVSARRIDGTYREDFMEGGKNAKDRRYPIMFLGTNEFAWEVNTALLPLDLEKIQKEVEAGNSQKKSKALWEAYQVAAEGNDLQYFKDMLEKHEQAMQVDAEERAVADAKKQEKKDKAGKRKSTAVIEPEDVEMEDAGDDVETKKAKPSKKRKKDSESDGEQPEKTPKTKLKLNNKAPKEPSATKPKKETKPKKAKSKSESAEAEVPKVEEKPMTEAERREKQEKSVLYLRHRLQKGFLSRDQAPKEEEMANMSGYLKQLEEVENLEAEVIRKTKVHKVLKAIVKLNSIPKEDEYHFKKRAADLLQSWSGALATDGEPAAEGSAKAAEPATNGIKHDDDKEDATSPAAKPEETSVAPEAAKTTDDGDVAMTEAKTDTPAVKADAEPSAEGATEVATETAAA